MINVIILDQSLKFENNPQSVQLIINEINNKAKENDLIFSNLIVDGIDVYVDHADYLIENIDKIAEIRVELKTKQEWFDDMLASAAEYFHRAVPALEQLSDQFYQGVTRDSWIAFEQMLEGVQWTNQLVYEMKKNESTSLYLEDIEELSVETLWELEQAVVNRDTVLIADIISYEITPRFKLLQQIIASIFKREVGNSGIS